MEVDEDVNHSLSLKPYFSEKKHSRRLHNADTSYKSTVEIGSSIDISFLIAFKTPSTDSSKSWQRYCLSSGVKGAMIVVAAADSFT